MTAEEFKIDETVIKIDDENINKQSSEELINIIINLILEEENWKN